jgi:CRISPR-associated endonuclease/helicase Cas3
MGRINRSCRKKGRVYFFNKDSVKNIYKDDYRSNQELTLANPCMQDILKNKNFQNYYAPVLKLLKEDTNEAANEQGLETFFNDKVAKGDFQEVAKHMRLIEDDQWHMTVYLSRRIIVDGTEIDGDVCWEHYRNLLMDGKMPYAQKKIQLSCIVRKMSNFIYQIKKNPDLAYNDRIGEIYKIDKGEDYFTNGKLDPEKFESGNMLFADF